MLTNDLVVFGQALYKSQQRWGDFYQPSWVLVTSSGYIISLVLRVAVGSADMPNYKLIYFDVRGRGELARLLFAATGTPFEDKRISQKDWPSIKPTTAIGQLPVLIVDGQEYTQSLAIASFVAAQVGLIGKTNLERLRAEEIISLTYDLLVELSKILREEDEETKEALTERVNSEEFPKYLNYFEKLLKKNGTGYFIGSQLTVADIAVYDIFDLPLKKFPDLLEEYPLVKALRQKIQTHPKLGPYVRSRPDAQI